MKSIEDCKKLVANEQGWKNLVTGHLSKYWEKVAILYKSQYDNAPIDFVKWMDKNEFSKSTSSDMWFSPTHDHMPIEEVYNIFKNK